MSDARRWSVQMARPAERRLARVPEKIATAVLEFVLGPLLTNPHRVGKPLHGELAGLHAARVGAYRVVYEIEDGQQLVTVFDVDHRADVYRSR